MDSVSYTSNELIMNAYKTSSVHQLIHEIVESKESIKNELKANYDDEDARLNMIDCKGSPKYYFLKWQ